MCIQLPINRKLHTHYIYNYIVHYYTNYARFAFTDFNSTLQIFAFRLHSFASNIHSFHSHLNKGSKTK